jgi:hypothetical protein
LPGATAIQQAVARGECTQRRHVAEAKGLIEAKRCTRPVAAGIAAARVVGVDAAIEAIAGGDVDEEIRGAECCARCQRGADDDAG